MVPDVGDARDEAALGCQPIPGTAQQPLGLAQMLENVAADDRVERGGLEIDVQCFDIADDNLVQFLSREFSGLIAALDAPDLSLLPRFECVAEPPCATADVQNPAGRIGNKGQDLGPRVAEVDWVLVPLPSGAGVPAGAHATRAGTPAPLMAPG